MRLPLRFYPILHNLIRPISAHWRWFVRIGIVYACLTLIAPPAPRAVFDPPQTVQTTQPGLCVHTRLIDEVEAWKTQRTLRMVREMGAPTIVEFFPWAYIEGREDTYDWASADRIVAHAANQGVRVLARLGMVPAWAREQAGVLDTSTLNTLPESAYDDFAAFAGDFARRYAGVIDSVIIWNEPNLAFEWGFQRVDAAGYARLLQTVYPVIHAANPRAQVIAAGLAPTLEPAGSPHGLNDVLYLDALYAAGGARWFDGLAVHTYGFRLPPDDPPAPDRLNFRRAELLREVMLNYGDADTPVYITEMGWNDHPRWTGAVTPAERITYTLDALRWVSREWQWARTACIWMFRTPAPTLAYPDHFTLVDTLFQPRPIYTELQAYARGERP